MFRPVAPGILISELHFEWRLFIDILQNAYINTLAEAGLLNRELISARTRSTGCIIKFAYENMHGRYEHIFAGFAVYLRMHVRCTYCFQVINYILEES